MEEASLPYLLLSCLSCCLCPVVSPSTISCCLHRSPAQLRRGHSPACPAVLPRVHGHQIPVFLWVLWRRASVLHRLRGRGLPPSADIFATSRGSTSQLVSQSENIQLQHQKAVFDHFQTLLDSSARGYILWKELELTIPKGVFRRLRLPEPFPDQRSVKSERRRIAPYTRQVPESLGAVPLLSSEEQSQLDALTRVRASQTARIAEAQKAAKEAEKRASSLLEASQIRKEKERLKLREEALPKASKLDIPEPEPQPRPSTSPRRPTLLERINKEIREQTIAKPVPLEVRSTASTPRRRYSKIIPAEKVNKKLAKRFARHGLETSSDEDEILKSPVSA
ncbi:hypothetical protein GHT06_018684 [Daphnia sinensis]|uniref:Uncharacterized protein n=1 Tax=Daphnia sinensis TaxID=1820382 RepID=A0AAD5PR19_9CRUS|nr:hypothetical protein GHT06_018684 [Daphnia sinensis]